MVMTPSSTSREILASANYITAVEVMVMLGRAVGGPIGIGRESVEDFQ
jgi:hypothetical protein